MLCTKRMFKGEYSTENKNFYFSYSIKLCPFLTIDIISYQIILLLVLTHPFSLSLLIYSIDLLLVPSIWLNILRVYAVHYY